VCIDTNLQNNFLLNLETLKQILFPSDIKLIFYASFEVSTALYQDSGLGDVKCDAGRGSLNIWKLCTAFTFKSTVFNLKFCYFPSKCHDSFSQ
jgi:hypothetical protein